MSERLPAHLEAGALLRLAESQGGFGMVLHKGDREAGTLLLVFPIKHAVPRLWERMPTLEGTREWTEVKPQYFENEQEVNEYLTRRQEQDPDLWTIELIVADAERFVSEMSSTG